MMRVAGAQLDMVVGDLGGNERRIAAAMEQAEEAGADVLLLPELAVTGYPPEDLVHRSSFVDDNIEVVHRLARLSRRMTTVVGFVDYATEDQRGDDDSQPRTVANAAAVIGGGAIIGSYHKVLLPNYGVFDEDRYFGVGTDPDRIWQVAGVPVGVSVCEDIWVPDGPPHQQAKAGAAILLNINASPFHRGKAKEREEMLQARARASGVPVVYLNQIGGQDELVFDGASLVVAADGTILHRSPQFEEDFFVVDVPLSGDEVSPAMLTPLLAPLEEIYIALTTGLRAYVNKNGFKRVVIGLSGGIDSALTATVAADALGAANVWGVAMPSRFSSDHSLEDAQELASTLGCGFDVIPIDSIFGAFLEALAPVFEELPLGVAEENLQARTRGAILMALSNKLGPMVLATGNKSELAAGYATLYGDMVGGFSVLKDVFKSDVYRLAEWRNRDGTVIPRRTIEKPPSAELRPNQRDSDSLPPYDLLDSVLERYIERDMGVDAIAADGFDRAIVLGVTEMVDRNEYKRRQSAPGVKVTTKAFGKDRRLPITNRYVES